MACPASGKITIQDLVNEFGGTAPHQITEYYRNGSLVPGNNTNVPESGQISLTQFYSAVNEILHTHSDGDTHADLATIFGSNWASTVPKRVVVPSGVTVGGTSTHAMNVPSGMGGTLNIVVAGNVHGHGGAANGGNGGNAINCVQTTGVTITLNGGTLKGGGGGGGAGGAGGTGGNGGAGGQGGQGRYTGTGSTVYFHSAQYQRQQYATAACNISNPPNYTGTAYYGHQVGTGYDHPQWIGYCQSYFYTTGGAGGAGGTSGGAGGAGGAGAVGQGYNQSAGSGSAGAAGASASGTGASGAAGGTSAGTGGTGGTAGAGGQGGTGGNGGAFGAAGVAGSTGNAGVTGSTGNAGANGNYTNGAAGSAGSAGSSGASGSSGGSAGYYIYNRGSITFNNNSGTVAGQ